MINQFLTVEDFISDESFQDFVLQSDSSSVSKWKKYKKLHPEHEAMISEAIQFVNILAPQTTTFSLTPKNNTKKYFYIFSLTFCLAILFSIWFFSLSANVNDVALVSKFAETENLNIVLPDLSEVELRKGSTIKYYEDWTGVKSRKVWLHGEAFFHVTKGKIKDDIFEVQLSDGLIRVLGTKFLARSGENRTSIVLEEGEVECLVRDQKIQMKEGDFLEYSANKVSIEHKNKVRIFDSWRSGKLSFRNISIDQIIATINNSYPIEVSLGNPQLRNRKITATVDQNDPMLLLQAIAEIYGMELIEKTNKVILK